jgi:hypothetical protein
MFFNLQMFENEIAVFCGADVPFDSYLEVG